MLAMPRDGAHGTCQTVIRALVRRYMREAGDGAMYDPRVQCLLCPVKRGALRTIMRSAFANAEDRRPSFARSPSPCSGKSVPRPVQRRRTTRTPTLARRTPRNPVVKTPSRGRNRWCHVVCAHWQQGMEADLYLGRTAAITGLPDNSAQYKNARCSACRLDDSACIPCSAKNCRSSFTALRPEDADGTSLPLQSRNAGVCATHRRLTKSRIDDAHQVQRERQRRAVRSACLRKRSARPPRRDGDAPSRARRSGDAPPSLATASSSGSDSSARLEQHLRVAARTDSRRSERTNLRPRRRYPGAHQDPRRRQGSQVALFNPAEAFDAKKTSRRSPPDISVLWSRPINETLPDDDEEEGDGEEDKK